MDFEYDPQKSESNKIKHGIDFEEAKLLWKDPYSMEFGTSADPEPRAIVLGAIKGKLWTAVITHRSDTTRIISVRRARDYEKDAYDKYRRIRREI